MATLMCAVAAAVTVGDGSCGLRVDSNVNYINKDIRAPQYGGEFASNLALNATSHARTLPETFVHLQRLRASRDLQAYAPRQHDVRVHEQSR